MRQHRTPLIDYRLADAMVTVQPATSQSPSPRVGAATAVLNGKIYLFSGRGGVAMAPIEEQGAVWEFDPAVSSWSLILPSDYRSGVFPIARSYHCMASDGNDTLFVHPLPKREDCQIYGHSAFLTKNG